MRDVEPQHVTVGGRRIAYRRNGSGPTVLLLHGGVSDGREWLPLMTDVRADADVVALDVPGCGGSDDPPPGCTLSDLSDHVAGVVRALDLGPVHLGGLSFGGGLALQVALRHPAVVRSLLLFSAYAGWAGSLPPEEVAERRTSARIFLTGSRPTEPAELVSGLLGSPLTSELADLLEQVTAGARPGPTMDLLEAFADADLSAELGDVRCPTLVVHGERDERAPRPVAEALHRGIPGSRLVVLPGVGHMVNLEARAETAALVRDVVARG
ncbi:MAG TPA: alpha/beta fold hydrolase [Actinomycetes bacterium]|nr:alpha/beta fold hydrolase [Actinomycetes bacterium]